jgi:hypothetical protein
MISWLKGRRNAPFAGAALLAVTALFASACGRPPDETWLRVLYFQKDGVAVSSISSIVRTTTTTTSTTTTTTGTTDYVDVVFANQSTIIGASDIVAGGVTINRVRITYTIAGYSPPGAVYAVTLYVPAGSVADTDSSNTTNTSSSASANASLQVALVSTALKSWLVASVPESALTSGLHASARLVFEARSDAGDELETAAGIGIVFENETNPPAE